MNNINKCQEVVLFVGLWSMHGWCERFDSHL